MKIVLWSSLVSALYLIGIGLILAILLESGLITEEAENNLFVKLTSIKLIPLSPKSRLRLWISGIRTLIKYWSLRSLELNLVLSLFLFFGAIFAAYYFYFRKEKVIQESAESHPKAHERR
ncbi:MAG: hypothetical protein AAFY98_04020 [Verrucomicrobiota bacterium]